MVDHSDDDCHRHQLSRRRPNVVAQNSTPFFASEVVFCVRLCFEAACGPFIPSHLLSNDTACSSLDKILSRASERFSKPCSALFGEPYSSAKL